MRIGKKLGIMGVILLLCLLIVATVLFFLIRQDDCAGKYEVAASQDLLPKIVASVSAGQEMEISEQEFNSFLAYVMEEKQSAETHTGNFQLHSLYLTLGQQEGQAGLYAPCSMFGFSIGITARLQISFDPDEQLFSIQFLQMKLGRLSILPRWGLQMIRDHLPDGVYVEQDFLYLPVSYIKGSLGEWGNSLQIQGCRIQNRKLFLRTNSMWDTVKKWGQERLADIPCESLLKEWENKGEELFSYIVG